MGPWIDLKGPRISRCADLISWVKLKGCISVVGCCHFCWYLKRDSSPLPSVFCASSKNYHERSAKPHNTHPLSLIGWNTIFWGFEVLIVPFVFLYDLAKQRSQGPPYTGEHGAGLCCSTGLPAPVNNEREKDNLPQGPSFAPERSHWLKTENSFVDFF